jgi:hypothetical protein
LRCVGIVVAADHVTLVHCQCDAKVVLENDVTWNLQDGARPKAYALMFDRLANYFQERKIDVVLVKASALGGKGVKLAHLEAAELRGVVQAAAAASSGVEVRTPRKANLSRTFGDRKVDEYLADDAYWLKAVEGGLRKGSREAALLVLSEVAP